MSKEKETELPEGYKGMMVPALEFSLFENHVESKLPNGITKSISMGDFVSILSRAANQQTTMNMVLLPPGCYLWGQTLTEMKIACYYPGQIRVVEYQRKGTADASIKFSIPFPNIIISHTLTKRIDKWEHADAKYFATSKTLAQLDNQFIFQRNYNEQIWTLPLGNIFPEGRLCQGNNSLPKSFRENFRGLHWHFAVLYNSPFNDDLRLNDITKPHTITTWYSELAKHKTFPYEQLMYGKRVVSTNSALGDVQLAEIPPEQARPTPIGAATPVATGFAQVQEGIETNPATITQAA